MGKLESRTKNKGEYRKHNYYDKHNWEKGLIKIKGKDCCYCQGVQTHLI